MKYWLAIFMLAAASCAGEKPKESSNFFEPTSYGESVTENADVAGSPSTDAGPATLDTQLDGIEPSNFWGVEDRPIREQDNTLSPPSGIDFRSDSPLIAALVLPYRIVDREGQYLAWLLDKTRRKFLRVEFEGRPDLDRLFDVSWFDGTEKHYHLPWGPSTQVTWDRDFAGVQFHFDPPEGGFRNYLSQPFEMEVTIFEPDTRCKFTVRQTVDFTSRRYVVLQKPVETIPDWSDACSRE